MAGILDTVDQRTQLVGENRLEILMFRLAGRQLFAINVFKVQEVLQLPKLTLMPQRHSFVCGVVNLRGQTLPVIDLSQAIGMRPLQPGPDSTIIVTEYNRSVQAFLVGGVDRIVNMNWEAIMPPPASAGRQHYLTAITKVDEKLVEVIDVEKVLAEIVPYSAKVSRDKLEDPVLARARGREVLLVDDSSVALAQLRDTLSQLGVKLHVASDGLKALRLLKGWADAGENVCEKLPDLSGSADGGGHRAALRGHGSGAGRGVHDHSRVAVPRHRQGRGRQVLRLAHAGSLLPDRLPGDRAAAHRVARRPAGIP